MNLQLDLNDNRQTLFGTFKDSDLKMSGLNPFVVSVGCSLEVKLFV